MKSVTYFTLKFYFVFFIVLHYVCENMCGKIQHILFYSYFYDVVISLELNFFKFYILTQEKFSFSMDFYGTIMSLFHINAVDGEIWV